MASAAIFSHRHEPCCKRIYRNTETCPHGRACGNPHCHKHSGIPWPARINIQLLLLYPGHYCPGNIAHVIPVSPGALGRHTPTRQILQRRGRSLRLAARPERSILHPRQRQHRSIHSPAICLLSRIVDITIRLQILYMGALFQNNRLISTRNEVKTPNETPNRVSTKTPKSNIVTPKVQHHHQILRNR